MAEQNNKFLMKNHYTCPISSASFPKVNATIFDSYFLGRGCNLGHGLSCSSDHGRGHGHKKIFKEIFYHEKWNTNVKRGKEKCENNDK